MRAPGKEWQRPARLPPTNVEFADGKPLELLGGSNLLFLLAEHVGIEARIEPPDDWTDPWADIEEQTDREAGDSP